MSETIFVERMILRVNGVDLDDVINDVSEDANVPSKFVNTMNKKRRPKGVKQANANFGVDISAERIVDDRIPDWHQLMLSRTTIQVVMKPNIGRAVTYTGRIVGVTDSTSDGDSGRKIKMMCWDRR